MEIQEMLLTVNKYSRPGTALKAVKGVVVHYVGNPGSTAVNNRHYFEGLKAGRPNAYGKTVSASSHYIVGLEGEIIRCVPENEVAYHAGNKEANETGLGIENCHPLADGKFTEETYKSLVELTADICARHGLDPLVNVIRHHDVTGKGCPRWYVDHPKDWEGFRRDVRSCMDVGDIPARRTVNIRYKGVVTEIYADLYGGSYLAKMSELSRVLGDVAVPVRDVLSGIMGYQIGWEPDTNTIMIK